MTSEFTVMVPVVRNVVLVAATEVYLNVQFPFQIKSKSCQPLAFILMTVKLLLSIVMDIWMMLPSGSLTMQT
jgi:hypothetical protein